MMNRLFIVCWLAVGAVAMAAPVPEQTARLAHAARIVFNSYDTICYSPDELAAVEALEGIPDEDIDALLRSEDAHLIGVGLFLADERELPEFFLRYPEILRDLRPTPLVLCSNVRYDPRAPDQRRYGSAARSVAAQYKGYLTIWFGAAAGNERMFHKYIAPDADPWLEVYTWRMVADRAFRSDDPERIARVRERMLRAPEQVRWLLIAGLPADHLPGGGGGFFTEEEARSALRDLSPAMQQAIREGRAPLPPILEKEVAAKEEMAAKEGAAIILRTKYYERAKRLLEDPEDPRP